MIELKYKLGKYIEGKFEGVKRKFTEIPYTYHLYNVAQLAHSHDIYFGYEIGLCHDLYEDTDTQPHELIESMVNMGYDKYDAQFVSDCVVALSKVYTGAQWTHIDDETKVGLETQRILLADNVCQSIKYCDIIDNIRYNIPFDKMYKREKQHSLDDMTKFILSYLPKKKLQLDMMKQGNKALRELALEYMEKNYEHFGLNESPLTKYVFPHES
tara:strand:+ start:423 stop:1061 length:639 start_codon:yes stop_codon:yes gene_type:complete